ncbi:MAG: hypothetical protein QF662_05285, partial [Phycisphaerae bacterium]|nr:hypothetical protein [Phycisphaerae bacterium]
TNERIGNGDAGYFTQSGGTNTVNDTLVIDSNGIYDLSGGRLSAGAEYLGYKTIWGSHGSGIFTQTGGSNTTGYLSISRFSQYIFAGGRLRPEHGLNVEGVMDVTGKPLAIAGEDFLLNFSEGTLVGAEKVSVKLGSNSLAIFAPGFDPNTVFRKYSNAGMTHTAGSTLVVAAGQGFGGWGEIQDHVESEGTIIATSGGFINLREGVNVAADGNVDLGSGMLTVTNVISGISGDGQLFAENEYIGYRETGTFTQTGGTNTVWGSSPDGVLRVGYGPASNGIYDLSGGQLLVRNEYVGVYNGGTGLFTQTGGTHTVDGHLAVGDYGNGTYELSGGELFAGQETVGDSRTGQFIQSGGSNTVGGTLCIGQYSRFADGTYILSAGQLSAVNEHIGHRNSTTGTFTQIGGTNVVINRLVIGYKFGSAGTYEISGGTLSAGSLIVADEGTGVLNVTSPGANITVSDLLRFGRYSTFTAVPGSAIHMTGADFHNESTDEASLAGLENLNLIFEGGLAEADTLEVAGLDMGAVPEGFINNFILGTLTLGGADNADVTLVDLFDNGNRDGTGGPAEALYIHDLHVEAGSFLHLNGLRLYYDGNFTGGGSASGSAPEYMAPGMAGDTDLDGDVDGVDLARLGLNWNPGGSDPENIWSKAN